MRAPRFWKEPTGRDAFVLSWISLVITLIAAIVGLAGYKELGSSLILVYGLENLVDFISSVIVLWRFYAPSIAVSDTNSTNMDMEADLDESYDAAAEEEAKLLRREKRASIGISIILAILGFGTTITASEKFATGRSELDHLYTLYYISFISVILFAALAVIKFRMADKLKSSSLKKDGICSMVGSILAISLFFNTVLELTSRGNFWWLDPLIALLCGLGSLIYGLSGVYKAYVRDGLPICSCSWWIYGGSTADFNTGTGTGIGSATGEAPDLTMEVDRGDGTGNDNGNGNDNDNGDHQIEMKATTTLNTPTTVNTNAATPMKPETTAPPSASFGTLKNTTSEDEIHFTDVDDIALT